MKIFIPTLNFHTPLMKQGLFHHVLYLLKVDHIGAVGNGLTTRCGKFFLHLHLQRVLSGDCRSLTRSFTTTLAPRGANPSAREQPSPAPVTMATLLSNRMLINYSIRW